MQEQERLERCAGLPVRVLGDHRQAAGKVAMGGEEPGVMLSGLEKRLELV